MPPLVRDALCTLELAGELVVLPVGAVDRLADGGVFRDSGAHGDRAHVLDATPNGAVNDPTGNEGVGQVWWPVCDDPHWASTVCGGDVERQTLREPGVAGDVHGLHANLADAPADQLADLGGVHARALDHGALDGTEELGGVDVLELAVAAAHRGPDGIYDHYITHESQDRRENSPMAPEGLVVVSVSLDQVIPIRHEVLRPGRPAETAHFDEDGWPGVFHLGVGDGSDELVGVVTLLPRPSPVAPEVGDAWQLRGHGRGGGRSGPGRWRRAGG